VSLIPYQELLNLSYYGFTVLNMEASDATQSGWPQMSNPHHTIKVSMKIETSSDNIVAISRIGTPTAPERSLPWHLQCCIMRKWSGGPTTLNLGSETAVPVDFRIGLSPIDRKIYNIDLTIQIVQPLLIPEEESLSRKYTKPLGFDPAKEDLINPTRVKPMNPKIRRPKKWV